MTAGRGTGGRSDIEAGDPAADTSNAPDRPRRLRPSFAAGMQQQIIVRLVLGGLLVVIVTTALAYYFAVPRGLQNPRSAADVLDAFMRAGAANDVTAANSLFSTDAIRAGSRASVVELFTDRSPYESYAGVRITRFEVTGDAGPQDAVVEAQVRYVSGPPGSIAARLTAENDTWRISLIWVNGP
jgi:hypothetical protein